MIKLSRRLCDDGSRTRYEPDWMGRRRVQMCPRFIPGSSIPEFMSKLPLLPTEHSVMDVDLINSIASGGKKALGPPHFLDLAFPH